MYSSVRTAEYSSNDAKKFAPSSCSAANTESAKTINSVYFTGIAYAVSVFFFAVLSIIIRRNILLIALPIIIILIEETHKEQNAVPCEG